MSNVFSGTGNVGMPPSLKTITSNGEPRKVLELRVFFDAYKGDGQGGYVQDDTTSFWKDVTLWGERAERAASHLVKGARIHVIGTVKGEKWKDAKTGEDRYSYSIVADDVFLSFARVESVSFRQPKSDGSAQAGVESHGQ
ncbi:MAG: single-stranded DNA-binding protein [Brachymonas sp.]|nr:single-stranded DNA-binding protein [Brachymonas sp.]